MKQVVTRTLLVWLGIMSAETVNGICRELFLTPRLGDVTARRVSFGIALALILLIAVFTAPYFAELSNFVRIMVGVSWAALTFIFEAVFLAYLTGVSFDRVLSDYDPRLGGLMGFGLLYLALAPTFGNVISSLFRRQKPVH